jgi:choline oxidase
MAYGLKLARRIAQQPALGGWAGAELAPGPGVRTDDELLDYIHKTHNTVYHPACTVKMGADDDVSAPLDARLRVKGTEGLRVADGSVMPDLVTVNPCITTMMIGEKCADLLRADA